MKALSYFLRSLFFVAVFSLLFVVPTKVNAELNSQDLYKVSVFAEQSLTDPFFKSLWQKMTTSVYERFKNDPDVNIYQFQKYVLEGIPGAVDVNQTGFIPYLEKLSNTGDTSTKLQAKTALAQAKNLLSISNREEQKNAGIISQSEADKLRTTASTENSKATAQAQKDADKAREQCSINFLSSDGVNIGACITFVFNWFIKSVLLNIAGVFFWLSANMFSTSINFGVLQFSTWAPDTLYPIWIVVRQIVSLVLVFVGLYLGFLYILGREDKFEKYIPWVVIFGLFVNFSYPLARTAIDVSNIVTLKVYTSVFGTESLSENSANNPGSVIMQNLGLGQLVTASINNQNSPTGGFTKDLDIPSSVLAVGYVFYASYVLFMFALIVILRTIILVFIIIASPLLLVDSVLPVLGKKAQELRGIFFSQLATGPVFMVLFTISVSFIKTMGVGSVPVTKEQIVASFFRILMMILTLHFTYKITKDISGKAGAWASEMTGKVGGFGLGVATGGTGLLARNTIGRAAAKFRDSDSKWVSEDNFVGRRLYNMSNSIAKSSFDLRNSNVVARGAGIAGLDKGLFGTGMGSGSKSNFDLQAENIKKSREAQRARIKTKLEREGVSRKADGAIERDENGVPILKKAGELDEYGKSRVQSFTDDRLKGSIFMTKEQKQAYDDEEVKAGEQALLDEYKKLKTPEQKDAFLEAKRKELTELAKTDKELKSVQGRTLARVTQDLEKGRKEEVNSLNEKVEEEYARYKGMTEDEQRKLINRLTKEVRAGLQEKLDAEKKAGEATVAEVSQSTTNKPPVENSTNKASVEETNWKDLKAPAVQRQAVPSTHTPSSAEMLAKRREEKLKNNTELARASMGEKIERKADEGNNSSEPEKPGFLKTPEERIRERGERIEAESSS